MGVFCKDLFKSISPASLRHIQCIKCELELDKNGPERKDGKKEGQGKQGYRTKAIVRAVKRLLHGTLKHVIASS